MADGDDELLFGAAAPESRRRIGSRNALDALWVVILAVGFVVASFFALVDLPGRSLRTGTAPYRIFAVLVPSVAAILAAIGARLNSRSWIAAATGALAPAIGLVGALSASVFFSDDSALAEAGAAISLAVAMVGAVMLVRWFVYHPDSIADDELRPPHGLAWTLGATACAVGVAKFVFWVRDGGRFELQDVVTLAFAMTAAAVVVLAAVVRSRPAFFVACSTAAVEVCAVVAARVDTPVGAEFDFAQSLALWLGIPGMLLLVAVIGLSVAGQFVDENDSTAGIADIDEESWRWQFDD